MSSPDTQPYAIAETLHIVEPTLEDYTEHCYSFIESLCRAGEAGITLESHRRVSL